MNYCFIKVNKVKKFAPFETALTLSETAISDIPFSDKMMLEMERRDYAQITAQHAADSNTATNYSISEVR